MVCFFALVFHIFRILSPLKPSKKKVGELGMVGVVIEATHIHAWMVGEKKKRQKGKRGGGGWGGGCFSRSTFPWFYIEKMGDMPSATL